MPPNKDGSRCGISHTTFCASIGLVFVVSKASEIFVLTEDFVLLGTITPAPAIAMWGPIAFDAVSNTIFAIVERNRSVVAFGLDGKHKPHLDLPDRHVLSIRVDGRGNVFTLERRPTYNVITCGLRELQLPFRAGDFIFSIFDDGFVFVSSSLQKPEERNLMVLDTQLQKQPGIVAPTDGIPLRFHAASRTFIVERVENCALEAVDLDGTVKFRCPTFFRGNFDSLRYPANVSWGCVLRLIEGDQITIQELIFEPVPRSFVLSRS